MSLLPRSRWSPLAAAALLGAALVACGDPFEVRATIPTLEDTLVVNSVSDASAPIAAPMTIDIADQPNLFDAGSRRPVARRIGPEFYAIGGGFDAGIDVQGDSVVFLPPRLLTTALSMVRRVGLRRDTVSFDSIRVAPGGGYLFDTVRVAARVGQTVTIVSQHPVCANEISAELYAKVGVIAIDPATRTATLRVRLDPNCGFRSFLPGVPRR